MFYVYFFLIIRLILVFKNKLYNKKQYSIFYHKQLSKNDSTFLSKRKINLSLCFVNSNNEGDSNFGIIGNNIDCNDLIEVLVFLKNNTSTKFRQLVAITAVDYPEENERFIIVYLLLSHDFNSRIIISYLIN